MYENIKVNVDLTARMLNFYKKEIEDKTDNEKLVSEEENRELEPGRFWEEMRIIADNNVGHLKYNKKERL